MEPAPSKILKIAREFLGLSQDEVEAIFGISRKSIQRLERGDKVAVHYAISLQSFYEAQGIEFVPPANGKGWGIFNANTNDDPNNLNKFGALPPSKRKKSEG